ncbi:hypothetical protein [Dehalobacterium formicoaceticum]|uniref:hypothetical protein n=1 Tax=Dehalobacterium formicoaceticum TaxID=51515 RepID=UPI000B7EB3D9|nr:hypothetical protein [Dehalobacterium formicoaceticum]
MNSDADPLLVMTLKESNSAKTIRYFENRFGKYDVVIADELGYTSFRDLKHTLDIRPVYHRLSDRIKSHVLLCWLGLLLIRMAEQELDQTWYNIKRTLHTVQIGHHKCQGGEVWMSNLSLQNKANCLKRWI